MWEVGGREENGERAEVWMDEKIKKEGNNNCYDRGKTWSQRTKEE
jgi:hypothetical protein